jgi:hypothetical protein
VLVVAGGHSCFVHHRKRFQFQGLISVCDQVFILFNCLLSLMWLTRSYYATIFIAKRMGACHVGIRDRRRTCGMISPCASSSRKIRRRRRRPSDNFHSGKLTNHMMNAATCTAQTSMQLPNSTTGQRFTFLLAVYVVDRWSRFSTLLLVAL